jgi:hypothetical protein
MACQNPAGGRPEEHCRRVVVDAIRYAIHNGRVRRALPKRIPARRAETIWFPTNRQIKLRTAADERSQP